MTRVQSATHATQSRRRAAPEGLLFCPRYFSKFNPRAGPSPTPLPWRHSAWGEFKPLGPNILVACLNAPRTGGPYLRVDQTTPRSSMQMENLACLYNQARKPMLSSNRSLPTTAMPLHNPAPSCLLIVCGVHRLASTVLKGLRHHLHHLTRGLCELFRDSTVHSARLPRRPRAGRAAAPRPLPYVVPRAPPTIHDVLLLVRDRLKTLVPQDPDDTPKLPPVAESRRRPRAKEVMPGPRLADCDGSTATCPRHFVRAPRERDISLIPMKLVRSCDIFQLPPSGYVEAGTRAWSCASSP